MRSDAYHSLSDDSMDQNEHFDRVDVEALVAETIKNIKNIRKSKTTILNREDIWKLGEMDPTPATKHNKLP